MPLSRLASALFLLHVMSASSWAKDRCQEVSPRAKVVYDESKDRALQPFYRDHAPWGITLPGPLAVADDTLYVADCRPSFPKESSTSAGIHRIRLGTHTHELFRLPVGGKIVALVATGEGVLWGVLADAKPDPGGGRTILGDRETLFSFSPDTAEYRAILEGKSIDSLSLFGDRVFVVHSVRKDSGQLVAFSPKTGTRIGACELRQPPIDPKCRGLRGEIDNLDSRDEEGRATQVPKLTYLAADGQRRTLIDLDHEGPGGFSLDPIPSGEILIVYMSRKNMLSKRGYPGFLLGPSGRKLGRLHLPADWGRFLTHYDESSGRLIRTCLAPDQPLRIYRESVRLAPWKD